MSNLDNYSQVKCLSVVIPVYNEEKTIETVIEKLLLVPNLLEIIIVDDGSVDRTCEIALDLASSNDLIKVIKQPKNEGKTAALRTGFQHTTGEVVIVQDADLEYDPADIPQVIAPIISGFADVVYGSRFMVKRATRVLYFYHYLANKGLTFFSNIFTNLNMTDIETCYKAFRGNIIRNLTITSSGFGFEIEVTAKLSKLKCALYEVPISYYGRTYEEGKKITFVDGIAAFFYILRFNLFCSLDKSFKTLPEIATRRVPLLNPENNEQ